MEQANRGTELELDTTLDALQGDVTNMDINAAVGNLDYWQQALVNSGRPEWQPLANTLAELKGHLASGDRDRASIGGLLRQVGEQIASNAENVPPDVAGKLGQLGRSLSHAADSLSR